MKIVIDKLKVFAHHGVLASETRDGQYFYVSAELQPDFYRAAVNDDLTLSVNYADVCHFITDYMQQNTFQLIETVAVRLCEELLNCYPLINAARITVFKPDAPIGLPFENVSTVYSAGWERVYLSIGSNMGDSRKLMDEAVDKLRNTSAIRKVRVGEYLITKPYGGVEQDDFLNGIIELETYLPPHALLDLLHQIECEAGRERLVHWGPRTLDLDIVLWENKIIQDADLIVPHPDMHNRLFVLEPLCAMAPYAIHPVYGCSVRDLLAKLK